LALGSSYSSSSACSPHLEISRATHKVFRADGFVRSPTTLSTSKGEDYENVESNIVGGCYRPWSSRNSEGGAGELLLFRGLLRLLLRL
jgi:hypothetical protein